MNTYIAEWASCVLTATNLLLCRYKLLSPFIQYFSSGIFLWDYQKTEVCETPCLWVSLTWVVRVKQPHYRPGQALRVPRGEAPRFGDSLHMKVALCTGHLYPRNYSWYSFLLADLSNEVINVLKPSLMTYCSVQWLLFHVSIEVAMMNT
jgi:hypothetical protein